MYWKLFISFFKIGAFTFGGGWAMLAGIEKEIVDNRGWMSHEDFYDSLSIVQALPGVLAVNIAASLGHRLRGTRGALSAALGAMLPSILIILAIAIFLSPSVIKENPTIAAIFKGIRPVVVALIIAPVISASKSAHVTWRTAIIPIAVALLIWSRIPVISNPILYIVIAITVGWWLRRRRSLKEEADKK